MNVLSLALFVCLGAACAQTAPPAVDDRAERLRRQAAEAASAQPALPGAKLPDLPDASVIAVFDDGAPFTMGDFRRILSSLPAQRQQIAAMNPKDVVQWWAGMRKLARMGEAEKLDQASPAKDQLAYDRTMILGQAMMNFALNTRTPSPDEAASYYAANKEQYKQVRVKALYIAFGDSAPVAGKSRTEEQAKEEATKLLAQIRAGADFVKLVKERSDDQTSREKDGDFATFHKKDNIPDALAAAVFALRKGDVSEPIRQPNGYYLLRAEEVSYVPLSQVQTDVLLAIRERQYNQWLQQNTTGVKVEFPNPAFPGPAAPPVR